MRDIFSDKDLEGNYTIVFTVSAEERRRLFDFCFKNHYESLSPALKYLLFDVALKEISSGPTGPTDRS